MVRKAELKDAKMIAELLSTFGDEIFDITGAVINTDKELIVKLFDENLGEKFEAFVYEKDSEVIGFITFCESFSMYAKGEYYTVTELYVDRNYRSQNIGKKLLDTVIELAKKEKKLRLELTTPPLPEFQKSLDFYLQNGFEISGGKKVKLEI